VKKWKDTLRAVKRIRIKLELGFVVRPKGYAGPIAEVSSPTPSSGAQQKFESLSPGDVESISEGEIPETEADMEGESLPVVKTETSELTVADKNAEVAGVSEEVLSATDRAIKLEQAEDEFPLTRPGSVEWKTQPSNTPTLPNSVPATGSPAKVSAVSSPSNITHGTPSTPPPTAASNVATPIGSPIPPDEPSIMVVEPYEPILSDEDIDETDAQVSCCL
jgi:hypothetical protein